MGKLTYVVEEAINALINAKTSVEKSNAFRALFSTSHQMSRQAVDAVREDFIERGLLAKPDKP